MYRKKLPRAVFCALAFAQLVLACSGKLSRESAPNPGAAGREPAHHRPSGGTCPSARGAGAGATESKSSCMLGDLAPCVVDSQCTQGQNPRCSYAPPFACVTACTSDECFSDADCSGNEPCACRASDSDPAANSCDTASKCRVDADCGPAGYCSPSLLGVWCSCLSPAYCNPPCPSGGCSCGDSCEHGYFCHTPKDGCLDDTDCKQSEYCAFDKVEQRFSCQGCVPIP